MEISASTDYKKALNYALRLLSAREYSRYELYTRLTKKFSVELSRAVLKTCDDCGYVSDKRCIQMLINHMYSAHYGQKRLFLEAVKRCLDKNLVYEMSQNVEWLNIALELLHKKYEVLPSEAPERQKILAFLYRRGFSAPVCYQALESF